MKLLFQLTHTTNTTALLQGGDAGGSVGGAAGAAAGAIPTMSLDDDGDGDGDDAGEGDDADVDDSGGAWLSDRLNRKVSTPLADGFYMVHSALPAWCSPRLPLPAAVADPAALPSALRLGNLAHPIYAVAGGVRPGTARQQRTRHSAGFPRRRLSASSRLSISSASAWPSGEMTSSAGQPTH